jgi:hypothetical protein
VGCGASLIFLNHVRSNRLAGVILRRPGSVDGVVRLIGRKVFRLLVRYCRICECVCVFTSMSRFLMVDMRFPACGLPEPFFS